MSNAILRLSGVRKQYGSLVVSDDVSLAIERAELYALIGPNGAGKSTLIGQIAGEIASDRGDIHFDGRSIAALSVDARARLGIARSFQVSTLFDDFTLEENLVLAMRGRYALELDLWHNATPNTDVRLAAAEALQEVDLGGRAAMRARDISHGERRQLEIAMALAMQPSLLLLDEPMAGLGAEESRAMIALLLRLRGTISMLLIEHDMDAVEALADRVGVLVHGRIIASGSFAQMRADTLVREAYLGVDG